MPQNNQAEAITHVRGKGRVLLIENAEQVGEFDFLVERLRTMNLEVDVQRSDALFTSLAELQAYDCVVLDLMLPGRDGFEVLRELRERGHHTPVLMLTARGDETDRIVGLEVGGGGDRLFVGGLEETRPAAAGVELGFRLEQFQAATGALVHPSFLLFM